MSVCGTSTILTSFGTTAPQGQARQGQSQQATVNLTSEQRTKIRQDIFSGNNVPRVDNANFSLRVDVIIVDDDHRIVAVMPVGSSAAQREGSVSLSQGEIREVQMKLNQKGFDVGQVDGVMGTKTKDGLAQFQRQQGLRESGEIDSGTVDALGISNAPATTGSAPRSR
jgi:Putative peptidoglycan binding domain